MVSGQRATPSWTKRCTMIGKIRVEVKWRTFRTTLSDGCQSFLDRSKKHQKLPHHRNFSVVEVNTASEQFHRDCTAHWLKMVLDFWQWCHRNHTTWWRAQYINQFPCTINIDHIGRAIFCSAVQWRKVYQCSRSIEQFGKAHGFCGVGGFAAIAPNFYEEWFFV